MNVSITARHCNISDSIRDRTTERMQKLTRYEPRLSSADVVFTTDGSMKLVEARVSFAGGPVTVGRGSADTFQMALDRTTDRLGRQLKRRRERQREHQASKPAGNDPLEAGDT